MCICLFQTWVVLASVGSKHNVMFKETHTSHVLILTLFSPIIPTQRTTGWMDDEYIFSHSNKTSEKTISIEVPEFIICFICCQFIISCKEELEGSEGRLQIHIIIYHADLLIPARQPLALWRSCTHEGKSLRKRLFITALVDACIQCRCWLTNQASPLSAMCFAVDTVCKPISRVLRNETKPIDVFGSSFFDFYTLSSAAAAASGATPTAGEDAEGTGWGKKERSRGSESSFF